MKKYVAILITICLFIIIFFIVNNLFVSYKKKQSNINNFLQNALLSYANFLYGNETVNDNIDMIYTINDLAIVYGSVADDIYFTLFDMNADGIPELHLRTERFYSILSYQNDYLRIWLDNISTYCHLLNNGCLLYERHGGAPVHINYEYMELDSNGNITFSVTFEKYAPENDDWYDEKSLYIFDLTNVSKTNWYDLTNQYLSIGYEQIEWHSYKKTISENKNLYEWIANLYIIH